MVLDPVLIPPLDGVHLDAVNLHGEVKMIARGETGGTALTHGLAALHQVAFLDAQFAQVAVDGLQTVAVIHHDTVAVNTERRGPATLPSLAATTGVWAETARSKPR